jgi:tetratricopeptide (TPR) repeat protein
MVSGKNKADVFFVKGTEYLNQNDWEKAGKYFKKAIQENPYHRLAHEKYQDVEFYYFEKKGEVLSEYQALMARYPKSAIFPYLLARILGPEKKAELLNKAISLDPTFVPAYIDLVVPEMLSQKYEEASKLFREALRQCPNSVDLLSLKADYLLRKGEAHEAIKTYRYVINQFRDSDQISWAYRDLAGLVDDPKEKIQLLENVLKYDVSNRLADVYESLYALYSQCDPAKAIELARKAISVKPPIEDRRVPSSGYSFLYRYYRKRDPSKAIEIIQELLKSQVRDPDLYTSIGNSLIVEKRELPLAIRLLEQSVTLNTPDNMYGLRIFGPPTYSTLKKIAGEQDAYYRSSLGWAYYNNGDYKRALKMLQSASGKADWAEAEIQYRLGQIYEKTQHRELAMSAYTKSLAMQEDEKVRKTAEDLGEKVTKLKVIVPLKRTADLDSLIAEAQLAVAKKAPDFVLKNLDSQDVSLSDYRGKVVLLDFWATWCGPCRAELPHFQKLMDSYKDNPLVVFVTVSADITVEAVKKFIKGNKYTFTVLLSKGTTEAFGVQGIPVLFVIDRDGKIRYKHQGFDSAINFEELMTKEINLVLGKQK